MAMVNPTPDEVGSDADFEGSADALPHSDPPVSRLTDSYAEPPAGPATAGGVFGVPVAAPGDLDELEALEEEAALADTDEAWWEPGYPITVTSTHLALAEGDPWELYSPEQGGGSILEGLWPWGLRGLAETLEVIGLAILMFLFVRGIAQNFIVDGGSMEPTFSNGEMLIVNKLAYRSFDISWLPWSDNEDWRPFGDPAVGDVVVFRFPLDPTRDFIKRVIAVEGQTVEVHDGIVIVDGIPVEEEYIDDPPRYDFLAQTVPEDHVFVLGDARNNSFDSHQWGMLSREFLIGRAELRYWPLGDAGLVGHEEPIPLQQGQPAAREVPSSP